MQFSCNDVFMFKAWLSHLRTCFNYLGQNPIGYLKRSGWTAPWIPFLWFLVVLFELLPSFKKSFSSRGLLKAIPRTFENLVSNTGVLQSMLVSFCPAGKTPISIQNLVSVLQIWMEFRRYGRMPRHQECACAKELWMGLQDHWFYFVCSTELTSN